MERTWVDDQRLVPVLVRFARLKAAISRPVIITADSEYFTETLLARAQPGQCELLIRLKCNRVLYDAPRPVPPGRRGAPPKHGPRLKLNQPDTLRPPDKAYRLEEVAGGWVELARWQNVHVREHPERALCILRVEVFRADGQRRFTRPLCLVWTGPLDMDWPAFWKVYLRRFSLASVPQFLKNSLVWTRARLGYTDREERCSWLVMLAYRQLLLALPAARDLRRPWEKSTTVDRRLPPGRVQRDMGRILALVGMPVCSPQSRGNPRGRAFGYQPTPRQRHAVVYKGAPPA